MGLNLIERYIFKKALLSFLIAGGGLVGVLWVVRAVQTVDVIMSKGQGIVTYLQMTLLGIPTLAAAIAPLALLIGLIRTINGLNDDSEMVVMHASGASRISLLKPFLALSLLVTLLVYTLHLWAGPASMQELRNFITKVRADLVSVVVKEGAFQDIGTGLTFHVAERVPGGSLRGVLITDTRSEKENFTYLAQSGDVTKQGDKTYLVLRNGQIQRQTKDQSNLSIVRFSSYAFNLSSFSGGGGAAGRSQQEVSTYHLLFPDPKDPLYKAHPQRFTSELHIRLTGGLYPLMVGLVVLAFLGMPHSHRQGQTLLVTLACLDIVALRGLAIMAEGAIRGNPIWIYATWFIPLSAIAFASWLIWRDKAALSPELLAKIDNQLTGLAQRTAPLRARLAGYGRKAKQPSAMAGAGAAQ
ncbi:MAG: LptF/LptG family permease [Pseudomonadota bacterium]